jgi:hypothetical protein
MTSPVSPACVVVIARGQSVAGGRINDPSHLVVDSGKCDLALKLDRREDHVEVDGQPRHVVEIEVDRRPSLEGETVGGEDARNDTQQQRDGVDVGTINHDGSTSFVPSARVPIHRDELPVGST